MVFYSSIFLTISHRMVQINHSVPPLVLKTAMHRVVCTIAVCREKKRPPHASSAVLCCMPSSVCSLPCREGLPACKRAPVQTLHLQDQNLATPSISTSSSSGLPVRMLLC
eukprot:gnl/TRDRNA2_/TRDRNA2_66844_c0_seq1.p1 gnl/TRDRNA2_/TRDRNA2_66844_c0~~gnl/TRDRNA2_/TRDRNA2_66844_c0_seq1.p1  ORF type:complete len:110 (-),score=2.45 gnl/TRDRNA2_/TRDRNA2_66844_c0_seq1:80-409(-)